jgi:DNA repair protein RadC
MIALVASHLGREAKGLSAFLRGVTARAGAGGSLDLSADAEVARFLRRLGLLEGRADGRRLERLVERIARASAREPLEVSIYLRAFASGEAALQVPAVCGEMPRCAACVLAEVCRYRQGELARPAPARAERPAERMRREGEEALTATELVSLVLSGRGLPGKKSMAAARRLMADGSLRELSARPLADLAAAEGLNEDLALRLRAALALARRWNVEVREPGRQFKVGRDFFEFFAPLLRDAKKETFLAVMLDQKNRYLGHEVVSTGTLTGAPVHPREVFRPAIREAAAAVAFVHNHPSGSPEPSRDDREITARLLEVARLVGLRVLDHVIVGEDRYFSFVEEGLM